MLQNEFLLLATAHVFAVASPGADFSVVLKNTLRSGKTIGMATALGVGLGILVHMAYTLFGVAVLVASSEILFPVIRYLGAGYLVWLAYSSFQSGKNDRNIVGEQRQTTLNTFGAIKQGFFVNVLNPKVTLFFIALFTNVVSLSTPLMTQIGYGLWLSIYTIFWFALVAWGFSRKPVLVWYQAHGHFFDWMMGIVLLLIAMKLIL